MSAPQPTPPAGPRLHLALAAGALGAGLWLLSTGIAGLPPALLWPAAILVSLGGLRILLEGFRAFHRAEISPSRFILPLTAAIGIASVLLLAEHSARYLLFPYPLDDGEGFCLNQAVRMASAFPLYPPLGPPPYVVTNYPPVFPILLGFLTDPGHVQFFTGRLLSVVSTAVLCVATGGCVRAATGDARAAWVAALMAAAGPVVYFWGALLRVDVLAAALGLIALWIAMRARGWRVLWSLPFLLAALFTRQSSVEAAIAIAVTLFLSSGGNTSTRSRGPIRSIVFVACWALGAVIILLALQAWTGGEFWRHTVVYTRTQFHPERIWSAAQWVLPSHALLFLIALFALPRALSDSRRRMLGVFFLASVATSLLAGKVGSDLNYFLNLTVASACLSGCFFADCLTAAKLTRRPGWVVAALLLVPAALTQSGLLEGNRGLSFTPQAEDYRNGARIVDILSSARGPVLSEDEGFCLLSGHEVLFNPFIMSELAREGIWDEGPFVEAIENKAFEIIMLRFDVNDPMHDDRPGAGAHAGWDRFTPAMERAIGENYEIDSASGPIFMRRWWFIYRPRSVIEEIDNSAGENAGTINLLDQTG